MTQQLPWSPDAEREILGAVLIDPRVLDEVSELLSPADWYHSQHRAVYETALELWRTERAVDLPLIVDAAERRGLARDITWRVLGAAMERSGLACHAGKYAKTIRDRAVLRRLIEAAEDISRGALAIPDDVEVYAAEAEQQLRGILESSKAGELQTADAGVEATLEHIYAAKTGDDRVLGLLTSFNELDEWTDGLPRGLTYVIARPKHGKSAFALQVARRVAERGWGVFVWSGEMPEEEVWGRMFGQHAHLCVSEMLGRTEMTPDELRRMSDSAAHVSRLPILLDCQTGLTANQVCARAQRAARELAAMGSPMRLAVVDHFHLMRHPRKRGERSDEAKARSSGRFRDWSKDEGQALLVCAQLSRGPERRDQQRPKASDIRECGAAEQDAKLILGLCWPYKFDQSAAKNYSELWVLEQRQGKVGLIPMSYDGPQMRWLEKQI